MYTTEFELELKRIKKINKQLSKIRVGLPITVEFTYTKGIVLFIGSKRLWVVVPKDKEPVYHYIKKEHRLDVTKYKARHFLKLAILGVLRSDKLI